MKFLLPLLFITILTLIISSGCGGGSGITQPSLSLTPATSDKIAYIIINVKWPNGDIPGSFIISSADNKNELTASMTKDTRRIEIRIYGDKSTPGGDPIGMATIKEPDTTAKIPVHIKNTPDDPDPNDPNTPGVLPVVPVKIWAGAFSDRDGDSLVNPISETLKDYTVVVGNNALNLQLGDYDLTLTADPNTIVLGVSTVSGSNLISNLVSVPTPMPVTTGESKITATLSIKYPGDPNDPNSIPVYKPVPYKNIHFTLEGGGNLSHDYKETEEFTGICTTTLTTTEPGLKTITATFQADPLDPNSIYTKTCDVTVTGDPNLELYELTLNWDPNSSNQFIIIPDFQSDDYSLIDNVTLIAKLMKLDPNTFQYNIPASKQITFTVTDNNITNTTTGTTDSDGCYFFNVPYNGNITPRTINVQASFQPDPNDEAKTVTDTLPVEVKDNKLFSENFESYEVNTLVNNFPNWSGSVFYGYENLNYIVSDGANGSNKSVQLYADINSTGVSQLQHYIGNSIWLNPTEYRFYIKNGTETLGVPPVGLPSGGTRTRGVFSCCGYSWLISCIYNGNEINDHIGNHLGNYGQDWIPIRVQIIPQGPHLGHKVIYYISDVKTNEFIHNSIDETFKGIKLLTYGGRVWFDEIEVYSFVGLPSKSNPNLRK